MSSLLFNCSVNLSSQRKTFSCKQLDLLQHLEMLVAYLNNPSEEAIFESNRIKEQHEPMKLQNDDYAQLNTLNLD